MEGLQSPFISTAVTPSTAAPRGLACAFCQQRKVKCDRTFPCNNCARRGEKCMPGAAVLPRQRRRRFAERELLERLRHYETLLRRNHINFNPLHKDHVGSNSLQTSTSPTSEDVCQKDEVDDEVDDSGAALDVKSYWKMVTAKFHQDDSDDSSDASPLESQIRDAWADIHSKNGYLLPFGQPVVPVDLSSQHPDQVTIFKLWQIYLDNVNPLLKVTHTPTLQSRIISAGSNVATIKPALNALMFSIYCLSILSMSENDCALLFGATKTATLMNYQICCQQALSNCGILCTTDREALTALFLYLYSMGAEMDPQSVSSLLGIAVRIARRMRLDKEASYSKLPALEAELRRRLWWSLVMFDNRICELAGNADTLSPVWDTQIPSNLNDFELQNDMQASPRSSGVMSEAVFVVVRSDIGDMVRFANYHLDFMNPALKTIRKRHQKIDAAIGQEVEAQTRELDNNYLTYCNPAISIHFMTIWMARTQLAKLRLMEYYSVAAKSSAPTSDQQRDAANEYALEMLEGDTMLMTHPSVKCYQWYLYLYLPMPAYFQVLLDLRRRPSSGIADRAWRVMSKHCEARELLLRTEYQSILNLFLRLISQAWRSCEQNAAQENRKLAVPWLVQMVTAREAEYRQSQAAQHTAADLGKMQFDDSWVGVQNALPTEEPDYLASMDISGFDPNLSAPTLLGVDLGSVDWETVDWNPLQSQGW